MRVGARRRNRNVVGGWLGECGCFKVFLQPARHSSLARVDLQKVRTISLFMGSGVGSGRSEIQPPRPLSWAGHGTTAQSRSFDRNAQPRAGKSESGHMSYSFEI